MAGAFGWFRVLFGLLFLLGVGKAGLLGGVTRIMTWSNAFFFFLGLWGLSCGSRV